MGDQIGEIVEGNIYYIPLKELKDWKIIICLKMIWLRYFQIWS